MGLTQFFLNQSNSSAFDSGFDDLPDLFSEIEEMSHPFYFRLARFVALTLEKSVALEKGFVFGDDGEPVFSKAINSNIDSYLHEIWGISDRVLRDWKKREDYAFSKRSNRVRFFKLAFALNLKASKTNEMFNKLFGHPAFIREPESLIFMRCLDNGKSFEYAGSMIEKYYEKIKITPANEMFETKYTSDIYNFKCENDEDYIIYLAEIRNQFEIANVRAVEKITELAEIYINRDFYNDKLGNIDYVLPESSSNPNRAWEGMEDYDESLYESEATKTEEVKSILTCFPLFLSVLSEKAPELDGKLVEAFYNSSGFSTDVDGDFDAINFSKSFNKEIQKIDVSQIDSVFFRKAFSEFPNIKLIYDEKLNDPEFAKFTKYEQLRKLLIMMAFLEFHTEDINGKFEDSCNIYLAQCGFGKLYAPNPFDFMFLLASNAEKPIDAFRTLWDYAFSLGTEE